MDPDKKNISINENNVHTLRNSLENMLVHTDMRKKLIGGISEEDVSIYVGNIRQQYQLIENELRREISELQASKDEIHRSFEKFRQITGEEKVKLQEALKNALENSSRFTEESSDKDAVISNINESFNLQIDKLTSENIRLENEIERLSKQILSTKDHKAAGIKNDIDVIYNQMVNLKSHFDVNENLQQQLETERMRSEKAEMEIFQLKEQLSGLQKLFDDLKEFFMNKASEIGSLFTAIDKNK